MKDTDKCRPGLTCINSKCTPNFSLENGVVVDINESIGCKSNIAKTVNGKKTCTAVTEIGTCTDDTTNVEYKLQLETEQTFTCSCSSDCPNLRSLYNSQPDAYKYTAKVAELMDDILDNDDTLEYY